MANIFYWLLVLIDISIITQLNNAVADAKAFIKILTEQYQFDAENTTQVYNEEATQDNILNTLNTYIGKLKEQDCLVVYFSGHGEYRPQSDEGFWIPYDGGLRKEGSWVSNDTIVNKISAIKSHHTLVIVDSCFAGALFEVKRRVNTKAALDKIPSRWLFTSGRHEEVPDGKAGLHSPFAENLLYFLKHNDAPQLSITQLVDHVTEATLANSKQQPRGEPLQNVGHKGGQFYFYKKGITPNWTAESPKEIAKTAPATTNEPPIPPPRKKWLMPVLMMIAGGLFVATLMWLMPKMYSNEKTLSGLEDSSLQMGITEDTLNNETDMQEDSTKLSDNKQNENTTTEKQTSSKAPPSTPEKTTSRPVNEETVKPKVKFKEIFNSSDEFQSFCGIAVNGLICAKYNDKWGYVKRKEGGLQTAIPFIYEEAVSFSGRFAMVKKNKRYGWIDGNGNTRIPFEYLAVGKADNGKADDIITGARVQNSYGKWGIINTSPKPILPFQYDSISTFGDDGIAIVEKDGAYGFIDRNGSLLEAGCEYEAVEKSSNGRARVKLFGGGWTSIKLN